MARSATGGETITLFASAPLLEELADMLTRPAAAELLAVIQRCTAQVRVDYAAVVESRNSIRSHALRSIRATMQ